MVELEMGTHLQRLIFPAIAIVLAALAVIVTGSSGVVLGWIEDGQRPGIWQIGAALALWLSFAWFAKTAFGAIIRRNKADDRVEVVPRLLDDVFGIVIFATAIITFLAVVMDQPVTGLIAASGVILGILGFAVRDIISDLFSGIALNIEAPFRSGDWLQFEYDKVGETGQVVEMNWRTTRLVTVQGRMIIIPNSILSHLKFTNLNKPHRYFRVQKQIVVDFSVPPERFIEIAMAAINATEGVVKSETPLVLIDECLDRGVLFSLHFWVPNFPEMFLIERQVVVNVLNFLNQAGLSPAYPKREIDLTWRHAHSIDREIKVAELLRRVSLFSVLNDEEIQGLSQSLRIVEYPEGSYVIHQGEPGDSLFLVVTGLLSASLEMPDGERRTVGQLRPGECFGEMSLLTGAPRGASVTATTGVTVFEITKSDLATILNTHPELIEHLSEIQAQHLAGQEYTLNASSAERKQISKKGLRAFLQFKISKYFGVGDEKAKSSGSE